jgi:hypothetical protein
MKVEGGMRAAGTGESRAVGKEGREGNECELMARGMQSYRDWSTDSGPGIRRR